MLLSSSQIKDKGREESFPIWVAVFNLVANGTKIDRSLVIMVVVAADVSSICWIVYTVLWIDNCTGCIINWGKGVGVKFTPNHQYLNVLLSQRKGFKVVGNGRASAHSWDGHHGGQQKHWQGYVNQHRLKYQALLHAEMSSTCWINILPGMFMIYDNHMTIDHGLQPFQCWWMLVQNINSVLSVITSPIARQ